MTETSEKLLTIREVAKRLKVGRRTMQGGLKSGA